jgi:hypothetical protein
MTRAILRNASRLVSLCGSTGITRRGGGRLADITGSVGLVHDDPYAANLLFTGEPVALGGLAAAA